MKTGKLFRKWTTDLAQLLYPKRCVVCTVEIPNAEVELCPFCLHDLNYTNFEAYQEATPLDKLFWGRIQLAATYALLTFRKGGAVQQVVHDLKYHNNFNMGLYFGKEMGEKLRLLPVFNDVDVLIPIPLHHRKKFIRGYNQAEMICRGIEQSTQIPIETQVLKRLVHSSSQTKKGKLSRWESMQHKFYGDKRTTEQFNHILIVDDVATTGSTLEICFHTLRNQFPNSKISVAVLAIAE